VAQLAHKCPSFCCSNKVLSCLPLLQNDYDIRSAKHTIEREQNIELPKLLNDENEITRKAAQELYDDEYLKKMSEKEQDRRLGKY
jgi:hypothetical protein